MGKGYLIDSNAIIDFFNKARPKGGRKFLFSVEAIISIITFIELFGNNKASDQEVKELQNFCKIATVHNIYPDVALITIKLRKNYKIKLPDALIAATALFYDLVLVARNVSDFEKIEGIEILNPHSI